MAINLLNNMSCTFAAPVCLRITMNLGSMKSTVEDVISTSNSVLLYSIREYNFNPFIYYTAWYDMFAKLHSQTANQNNETHFYMLANNVEIWHSQQRRPQSRKNAIYSPFWWYLTRNTGLHQFLLAPPLSYRVHRSSSSPARQGTWGVELHWSL